jgi:CBS domain-containing protein
MHETKEIMSPDVVTVKPDTPLAQVVEVLVDNDITGVPVVDDDGTLLGVITEKDVLGLLAQPETGEGPARDYMTTDVVHFDQEEDLIAICESLVNNRFRRVPILSDGKLVGIISRRDVIKYILEPIG